MSKVLATHAPEVSEDHQQESWGRSAEDERIRMKMNVSSNHSGPDIIDNTAVQAVFCLLYSAIFVLGLFGNALVCYVVGRNKAMHTVTNCFITNLALSDILLCTLAVPFTPLYSFLGRWIFGGALCHLVAYAQGTSVYISTLTLTSIAVDRFFVIIYPFKQRMKLTTCITIIICIWGFSLLATIPYGLYMDHSHIQGLYYCEEKWPSENLRQLFGGMTATLQFIIPFIVITFCYTRVSGKLSDRIRSKPGSKSDRKEEADRERKRRTNRMLIAMVVIFGVSWLPLNLINLVNDVYIPTGNWRYYYLCFFLGHAIAMSSTCYNPFLYAWLNDNFRKEFKQVLPCFGDLPPANRTGGWRSERTCNGNETCQETLLTSTALGPASLIPIQPRRPSPPMDGGPENKCSRLKSHDSVEVMLVAYSAGEEAVHIAPNSTLAQPEKELLCNQEQNA